MGPIKNPSLDALLTPMGVDTFFREVWGKKALHQSGDRARLDFLGIDLDKALAEIAKLPRNEDVVPRVRIAKRGGSRPQTMSGQEGVRMFQEEGATMAIDAIDRVLPSLRDFVVQLKIGMGFSAPDMQVNGYISSESEGFDLHFDNHHVWLLQIEGNKRWRFSETPIIQDVFSDYGRTPEQRQEQHELNPWEPLIEAADDSVLTASAVMTPGDMLYLPPGFWHVGDAEEYSFGLTISFSNLRMLDLIHGYLMRTLYEDLDLRAIVPPLFVGERDRADPHDWDELTNRALGKLQRVVRELTPEDLSRPRTRSIFTVDGAVAATPWGDGKKGEISPDDVFEQSPYGPLRYAIGRTTIDDEPELVIYGYEAQAELPVEAEAFAKTLCEQQSFVAKECMTWWEGEDLEWDEVVDVLTLLEDVNLVRRRK